MKLHALFVICLILSAGRAADAVAEPWREATFTTSDGVKLRYISGGTGTAIVFIPGWSMPAEIWEPQLRHFASSYHVVALDPRSQGGSEKCAEGNSIDRRAKDIEELLQNTGGAGVVLVGWSLGSREILHFVEQFGTSRLAGIVLVDDRLWTSPGSPALAAYERMLEQMLRDREAFTESFVRSMYRTPQDPKYLARITQASLRMPTPTAYTLVASAYLLGRRDYRPVVARIDRPLLYVGTQRTKEEAEYVRTTVTGAQAEVFEQAGHALFIDEPARFNAVLESFLKRVEDAKSRTDK